MLWRRWTRSCSTRPAGICSRWMAWRTRGRGGRGAGWWSWEHRTSRCRTAPGMTASGTGGPACTRPARSSPRDRTPPAHTPSVQWTPPRMHDPRGMWSRSRRCRTGRQGTSQGRTIPQGISGRRGILLGLLLQNRRSNALGIRSERWYSDKNRMLDTVTVLWNRGNTPATGCTRLSRWEWHTGTLQDICLCSWSSVGSIATRCRV